MVRTGDGEVGDLRQSFQSRHVGHGEIEEQDVRLELAHQLDGLRAVRGFADDAEARLHLQQLAQPVAEDGMVVGDEDADRRFIHAPSAGR